MIKNWKIIIPALLIIAAVLVVAINGGLRIFGSKTSIKKFEDTSDGSLRSYLNQAQNLAPRGVLATSSTTFLAVGDIMLSRNVAAAIQKSDNVDLPFSHMREIFNPPAGSSAFNFGNLESPIAVTKAATIIGGHSLAFGAPATNLEGLKENNFKLLNLANNHAFDQSLAGLEATRLALDGLGIAHEGTGETLGQAWEPAVINAGGIKVCFIGASYSSVNDGGQTKNNYVARIQDTDYLKSALLVAKGKCDFTVVTMHAGTEYTRTPNKAQVDFAHAAIDYGADMVIGAHPHWIQTIEKYCPAVVSPPLPLGEDAAMHRAAGEGSKDCPNPKYIFYSLGNFIFDQMWSQDTKEGLTLKITVSKNISCPPSPQKSEAQYFSPPLGEMPSAAEAERVSSGEKSEIVMPDLGRAKPDQQSGKLMSSGGQRGCADNLQGSRIPAKLDSIELLPVIIENSQPRPATANEAKKILGGIKLSTSVLYP